MNIVSRWRIALTCLAIISGIATIVSTHGLVLIISVFVLSLVILFLVVTWLADLKRVPQLAQMDFFPKAPYTVSAATEEDIRWAADTARRVYSGLDVIPIKLMVEWFNANPTGFSIIKDRDGHRCGNIDILPLKPDTLARFLRGELIEREIRGDSIFCGDESDKIDSLYIESFVALTEGDKGNPLAAYKCIMHSPELIRRICNPSQIKKVYAIGASQSGIRLMKELGFDRIKYENERRDRHQVFSISFPNMSMNITSHAEGKDRLELLHMLKELGEEPTL